ncbi:DUF1501 domain-containing protein [Stieleria neptunia]|uniref:DUF1501 domain-containing protein n=1 Tax=Stieleria neptunia TaxID=2527979 RepID=UPI0036F2D0C0
MDVRPSDSVNHPQSVYQMNSESILMGNPSVGSWVAYGPGSENQNMPAFVVLPDPGGGLGPPAHYSNRTARLRIRSVPLSGYNDRKCVGFEFVSGKALVLCQLSIFEPAFVERKRGQVPKTKWSAGCFAFLVPDPCSAVP